LRRHDFSETSLVVSLLSQKFGKFRALAKGAKRLTSPLYGGLEPLTHCDVVVYRKRPPTLHILSQAKTLEPFRGIRKDLKRFYAAHHFAELLLTTVPDELPQIPLFERALKAFRQVNEGGNVAVISFLFETGLLRLSGSFPRTEVCLACERPWVGGEATLYHPPAGGAFHPACAREKGVQGLKIGAGTLQILQQFAEDRVTRPDRVSLASPMAREMRAFLDATFRFFLERDLRTRRFLGSG
jgi:DNA repair protein RecO (recombination protein O)